MGKERYCYRQVLPFAAMFMVECTNVGLSTSFKAASLNGMSYSVFIVYSHALSTLLLFPLAFIYHRKTPLPPFTISLGSKFCLLGLLSFSSQLLGYKGIGYSSPTLNSAMSNLTPACTFILAIIFRMEKLKLKSSRSRAKIVGTIALISGALVVVLYKGPAILGFRSPSISLGQQPLSLRSEQSDWTVGGLLLAAGYILVSVWYILQTQTVKEYPAEVLVVFWNGLCSSIISAPVCLILEPNLSAWKLKADVRLLAILYSGVIGIPFGTVVHTWGFRVKGPVYVALFKPFSIVIATVMSFILLRETLYLGSIVGSSIISIGFYVVMWGKTREEMGEDLETGGVESPFVENTPLLLDYSGLEASQARADS